MPPPRVLRCVRSELETARKVLSPADEPVVGLAADLPDCAALVAAGFIAADFPRREADAYAVFRRAGRLHVLGSTPRGLLHAVYALDEALRTGSATGGSLRLDGTFQFRERIFHARFDAWPGTRADVRVLSRLGATHCLVAHDWQGSRRSLQGYVTSPLFPDAVDAAEVAANHAGLRRLIDDCADHGLGAMLWLTELPCQGGPWVPATERERFLTRYDPAVLSDSGTYEGRVLCFGHERVQDYYRDLLQRFFADFPEIETLFVFGLDSGGEFCDPATCPRCRGMNRIAQRDRLVTFLIDEGRKVRPGLRVLTTGWKWDRDGDAFLAHQARLPAASGVYLAAQKDGWQGERQSHDFLRAVRAVCREHGQTFIGYDNLHWGDDSVHGVGDIQDFPLGIGAKLRRWHGLGADGVFDHWGHAPQDCWSNSVACRDFFLDPSADPTAVARRIAFRQFGEAAGGHALAAWQAIERAHVALGDSCLWSPEQWPMWYAGRKRWPLPGPEAFGPSNLAESRQPPRHDGARTLNPPAFADALAAVGAAWRAAAPPYEEAVGHFDQAIAAALDEPVFYTFWWNGEGPAPTRREHLRRQRLHAVTLLAAGREIGLHFALHAIWERVAHDPAAYRAMAAELLGEDAAACDAAADIFADLGRPKDWAGQYRAKAAAIRAFLA